MIWATWRMERLLYAAAAAVLVVFAVLLALAGAHQQAAWLSYSDLHCNQPGSNAGCMSAADSYYNASRFSGAGVVAGFVLPGLLGLVLGAPIVASEMAQRTNRLAWTQSITRTRWLLGKLAVGALATAGLLAAMMPLFQWWTGAVQRGDRIIPPNFDVSGIVPIAYGLFAFSVGALLGAVVRRTGWAFALGLPIFALARYAERSWLRLHLLAPVSTTTVQLAGTDNWVVNEGYLPLGQSSPGHGATWQSGRNAIGTCNDPFAGKPAHTLSYCATRLRLHYVVQMQPGSHYWALQLVEAAVFVAAAIAVAACTVFAVRSWRT